MWFPRRHDEDGRFAALAELSIMLLIGRCEADSEGFDTEGLTRYFLTTCIHNVESTAVLLKFPASVRSGARDLDNAIITGLEYQEDVVLHALEDDVEAAHGCPV